MQYTTTEFQTKFIYRIATWFIITNRKFLNVLLQGDAGAPLFLYKKVYIDYDNYSTVPVQLGVLAKRWEFCGVRSPAQTVYSSTMYFRC